MTLDLTKPVQTRDGRKARIIATDLKSSPYSVVAIYETRSSGSEVVNSFTRDGLVFVDDTNPEDLVNVPKEKKMYINFYGASSMSIGHETLEVAQRAKDTGGTTYEVRHVNGKIIAFTELVE